MSVPDCLCSCDTFASLHDIKAAHFQYLQEEVLNTDLQVPQSDMNSEAYMIKAESKILLYV